MQTLVKVRDAVTGVDAGGIAAVVNDAGLLIEGGRIAEIGPAVELAARHRDAVVVRFPTGTALPGLVNGHHHVGITPFQKGVPDLPLEPWIVRRMAGRAVSPYLDTLYAAFEMIESGITTVQHLYANRSATGETMLAECQEIVRAYQTVGMRVSLAIMFFDQNPVSYTGSAFYERLTPAEWHAIADFRDRGDMSIVDHARIVASLRLAYAGVDGVRIQLAPGNLQWCSHGALESLADIAAADDLPVHMHLLETPTQRDYADWRCNGKSPVRYLHSLGFAGRSMTLGHGVWLRRDDIDELRESGFSVCHNCSSNLRLSSGIAPVRELLAAGVKVAMGIDEAGLNDDRDMLTEMRLALHLHKAVDAVHDSVGLKPGQILDMATASGAATTGFGSVIGALEPGRMADFFIFDTAAAAYPGRPDTWPALDILCHRGKTSHVLATFVGGREIYRDGQFAGLDRSAVLAEIARQLTSAGLQDAVELAVLDAVGEKLRLEHRIAAASRNWFCRR